MNTSTGSEPEEDGLVVSMVSARIQLTFTANSSVPCDGCREYNRECTGRTRNASCASCKALKKACKVSGISIRVPRSTKQVADPVRAAEEGSNATANATVERGLRAISSAKKNLGLAQKVQELESLVEGLYEAAIHSNELLPVLTAYMTARRQGGGAQQTYDHEPVK
jgi:hypothetical protein